MLFYIICVLVYSKYSKKKFTLFSKNYVVVNLKVNIININYIIVKKLIFVNLKINIINVNYKIIKKRILVQCEG